MKRYKPDGNTERINHSSFLTWEMKRRDVASWIRSTSFIVTSQIFVTTLMKKLHKAGQLLLAQCRQMSSLWFNKQKLHVQMHALNTWTESKMLGYWCPSTVLSISLQLLRLPWKFPEWPPLSYSFTYVLRVHVPAVLLCLLSPLTQIKLFISQKPETSSKD